MRITLTLLKKLAPGKIDIGKHRYILPIRNRQKAEAVVSLIQEEKNMHCLRESYLTSEESKCLNELFLKPSEEMLAKEETLKKEINLMFKSRDIETHLDALNATKCWE